MDMTNEPLLPHKLTLSDRKNLSITGATDVVRFDDTIVVLKTTMGTLAIHGKELQLKNLSLEGGQVAVEGVVDSMVYEEERSGGLLSRLWR
jgi:sporulation protein YabP